LPAASSRDESRGGWQSEEAGIPSTILQERITNPFLRADVPELKEVLHMPQAPPTEIFAELRRRKDAFY